MTSITIDQDGEKQRFVSQGQARQEVCREVKGPPTKGVAVASCCNCICLYNRRNNQEKENYQRRPGNVILYHHLRLQFYHELINFIAIF